MQRTKRIVDLLPETDIAFQKETFSRNRLLYNVTQIGVCVGGVRHSISRERYDAFALFYLREGAALLEYDGKTFRAEAGDLLFWDQRNRTRCATRETLPLPPTSPTCSDRTPTAFLRRSNKNTAACCTATIPRSFPRQSPRSRPPSGTTGKILTALPPCCTPYSPTCCATATAIPIRRATSPRSSPIFRNTTPNPSA